MPANLPPDYLAAEKRLRQARTPEEKVSILEEMLAIIPKHKGTDHLQGDLKAKIAALRRQMERRPGGARRANLYYVGKDGAGQVVLVGPPNSGKSMLLSSLTRATPEVAPYPFTTHKPLPGMMPYQDIQIQLVDLPPFTPELAEPWQFGIVRNADLVLIIIDVGEDACLEQLETLLDMLEKARISIIQEGQSQLKDGFWYKRGLVVANKEDLPDAAERVEILRESLFNKIPLFPVSAMKRQGLEVLKEEIYRSLDVIRTYTKAPGKPPSMDQPVVLKKGSTVIDAARSIHKDFAQNLKYARIWGKVYYNGQRVERHHILEDGDIVEFHI